MQNFAGLQIDYIKTHMIAEANVADALLAVHGVREDAFFAYVLDLPDQAIRGRIEDGQHCSGAEIHAAAVETHEAVVGLRADVDSLNELARLRVDDENTAIVARIPPARGHIKLPAIHGDGGSVAARVVGLFPNDLFGL